MENISTPVRTDSNLLSVWKNIETLLFVAFGISVMYLSAKSFFDGTFQSFSGKGFLKDISAPVSKKEYYKSVLAVLSILTTFFLFAEMIRLAFQFRVFSKLKNIGADFKAEKNTQNGFKYLIRRVKNASFINEFLRQYKTNFLAKFFNEYISKLFIIFVYIELMPYFEPYALFSVPFTWWGWLYAYLMWELTYWIWHYLGHTVRLFWCLHSPHHAPVEMNLTVAWVHFFAEGYYTAIIQVPLLMIFGVNPEMVAIILVIDGTWGTFIHAGENAFKNGRFGFLEKLLITPSHHRVHHASNPLYMDTNFCVLLPFWDWLFGTLQNEREEEKIRYGITREVDATSFIDMYFGEFICLFRDLKQTPGLKNKFLLLWKPPGWTPAGTGHTAKVQRRMYIKGREYLSQTSRDKLIHLLFGYNSERK